MLTIKTNLPELIEKFRLLKAKGLEIDFSAALLVGVNAAKGRMQYRIFNQGLDTNGLAFGKYVGKKTTIKKKELSKFKKLRIAKALDFDPGLTPYEKKRLRKGRQISYKDLEFTGDLRRGIVTGKDSNIKVICWIPNDELFKIASYQEEQIGKIRGESGNAVIFSLSKEELELVNANTKAAITQLYDRLLNNL